MVKELNQFEKAALLMLSLGTERAAKVLKHMSPSEIHKLGSAMASVEEISISVIDKAVEEFIITVKSQRELVIDKDQYIRKMMNTALGEDRAKSIICSILPEELTKGIEQLRWMDGKSIADIIGKEHPQIIAIILSVLGSEQSSEIMAFLPDALRPELLMRIASMKGVQPTALRELDQILEKQLPDHVIGMSASVGGVDSAARILNFMESRNSDIILRQIADQNAELAQEIEEKMFVFEDIIYMDARGIQTLLREISTGQLLLALKNASDELKDKIFRNMSRRAAEMLRDDLAAAPAVKMSEIEFARKDILHTVKKLVDAGEIKLGGEEKLV